MKMPNVNCKHADGYGQCNKKPFRFFGFIKHRCPEIELQTCDIADRFERPKRPPPSPQMPKCNRYDGTNGNGYQPCGCNNHQPKAT